jgi:hypothetical protein
LRRAAAIESDSAWLWYRAVDPQAGAVAH